MAKCPYTWVKGIFRRSGKSGASDASKPADNLMVRVVRNGEERVLVALPARSARWLLELIPDDVVNKIREEEIPIDDITRDIGQTDVLYPGQIFSLSESGREVHVWLE